MVLGPFVEGALESDIAIFLFTDQPLVPQDLFEFGFELGVGIKGGGGHEAEESFDGKW